MLSFIISSLLQHYEVFMSTKTQKTGYLWKGRSSWVWKWFWQICCSWENTISRETSSLYSWTYPRELSRYIWYAFQYGAIITAEVKDERPKRSPLVHGGLETLIKMSIVWDNAIKINKNKKKTRNCSNRELYKPKQQNSKRNEGWCKWRGRGKLKKLFLYFFVLWWNTSNFLKKNVFLGHPVTILQEFFFNWYKLKLIQFTRYIN